MHVNSLPMKLRNIAFTLALAASSFLMGGCVADDTTAHTKTTVFGVYTSEPESFKANDPASITLRTEDATGMELPSGDRTKLFWGLVSLQDY